MKIMSLQLPCSCGFISLHYSFQRIKLYIQSSPPVGILIYIAVPWGWNLPGYLMNYDGSSLISYSRRRLYNGRREVVSCRRINWMDFTITDKAIYQTYVISVFDILCEKIPMLTIMQYFSKALSGRACIKGFRR